MRSSVSVVFAVLLSSTAALAADETEIIPQPAVVPTLTAEQPTNPVASKPGGPIIQSLSARLGPQMLNVTAEIMLIGFNFVAPKGNAVLLHRELVGTSANNLHFNQSVPINIPADAQKQGATITSNWNCNTGQYAATMRVYIMDADGNRSNDVRYTVHCNGG